MSWDEIMTVQNQAVAFCITEEYRGMQCGILSTASSTEASEFRTYWFSYDEKFAIIDEIKDTSFPLDLWDSANDANMIDDHFYGLTQFFIRMPSSTSLVADKFQYKQVTDEIQWSNVNDYRLVEGDTISLYKMVQTTSGDLVWDWTEGRSLGATPGAVISAAAALFASLLIAF